MLDRGCHEQVIPCIQADQCWFGTMNTWRNEIKKRNENKNPPPRINSANFLPVGESLKPLRSEANIIIVDAE